MIQDKKYTTIGNIMIIIGYINLLLGCNTDTINEEKNEVENNEEETEKRLSPGECNNVHVQMTRSKIENMLFDMDKKCGPGNYGRPALLHNPRRVVHDNAILTRILIKEFMKLW